MSQTFSIYCAETNQTIWVGQGWGEMSSFYSGNSEIMERLGRFLRVTAGKPLVLVCDDTTQLDADEFEGEE
jgi:hypothetical protein